MRTKKNKLLISRETLRGLSITELAEPAGGTLNYTQYKTCQLPPSGGNAPSAIVSTGGGGYVYKTLDDCNALSEIKSCKSACICI